MDLRIFDDPGTTAGALARRVADALRQRPETVLGLPTGRSPITTYATLRRMCRAGEITFAAAATFNLDEFLGVGADHPGSFRRFMEQHLFGGIDIDRSRIHFLDGSAPDPEAECARYEDAVAAAGGLDLLLLGLGGNGHLGFNEPGDTLVARTHRVRLHESTRRDNAALFGGDPARVPAEALSMGMGTILRARRIVLIATGERKARCVREMVTGPLTTRVPASWLQTHAAVEIYLDRAAASRL